MKCNILLWCDAQKSIGPKESGKKSENRKRKHSGMNQPVSKCQQAEDDIDRFLKKNMGLTLLCRSYGCGPKLFSQETMKALMTLKKFQPLLVLHLRRRKAP